MLKKSITYTDYNGLKRTEDFYFNLSRTELARMEMREAKLIDGEVVEDGFQKRMAGMIERGSGKEIIDTLEWIIKESYGVRSEDGRRFIKNDEVFDEFFQSPAYDEFFMEMVTDAKAAANFINAVVPEQISQAEINKPQDYKQKETRPSKLEVVEDIPEDTSVSMTQSERDELEELRRLRAESESIKPEVSPED